MKISIVLPNHAKKISGGYKVIFEYANYLSNKGHKIIIHYMMNDFVSRRHIPKMISPLFGRYFAKTTPSWFSLSKNIDRISVMDSTQIGDADVTVATDIRTVEVVRDMKKRSKVLLYLIQGYETWYANEDYVNNTYSMGMCNVVVSKWLKEIVDKCSNASTFFIPDGIDGNVFYISKMVKRERYSLSFHYRSSAYKGCDVAIKVVEKLVLLYPHIKIHVVTSEKTVPLLPEQCEVHQNIRPEEVAKIDNSVSVFLCTSREEGYGLPGLEAMACGAALVSTNYLGVREYAIDYDYDKQFGNSLLAPIDDVNGLVDRISRIFENQQLRKSIVENGLKTSSELTVEKSAAKFEKLLFNLVNNEE